MARCQQTCPMGSRKSRESSWQHTYSVRQAASYVQMFAESTRHSGVEVVIVGSPPPTFELPPNVRHFPLKWEELVQRVSTRLFHGEPLPILSRVRKYKVVDLKPFFAYLFPELVEGYDWWGHLDNDLLLGDVRHFVTDEMLRDYHVISPLTTQNGMLRTWGPFTLYRNANTTNQLFRLVPKSLKRLLDTKTVYFLDEWGSKKTWNFNFTMSGILTGHKEIKMFQGGIPVVWDGLCEKGQEHCTECALDLTPNGEQRLMTTVNCTDTVSECQHEEVLLCHYQKSKSALEKSLVGGNDDGDDYNITKNIKSGRLQVNSLNGLVIDEGSN